MTVDVEALLAANRAAYEAGRAPAHEHPTTVLTEADLPKAQGQFERHVVLSDYHIRTYRERVWDTRHECYTSQQVTAHDPAVMAAVEAFMDDWRPDVIWYNGDMIDAHQVSRFCQSPRDMEGLQEDLDVLHDLFKRHEARYPHAEKHYLLGNHEARLQKYIATQAPGLDGLRVLSDAAIFGTTGEMRVYPYPRRVPIIPGVLEICHGDKVAQKSGATAQKMLDMGVSGVSGHVHRLAMSYRTARTGTTVWAEGGCLCRLDPEYVESPNWQNGFTLIWVDKGHERFFMEQVPIIKGRAFHAGQVYQAA